MKKNVVIHIGTPKTGTTAVQLEFKTNRLAFLKAGILYPQTGQNSDIYSYGQHLLSHSLYEKSTLIDWVSVERSVLWKNLVHEIDLAECHTAFISSEDFIFVDGAGTRFISEMLNNYELITMVSIRPQSEFLLSSYAQSVKDSNFDGSFSDFVREDINEKKFFFGSHIERWGKIADCRVTIYNNYDDHRKLLENFLTDLRWSKPSSFVSQQGHSNTSIDAVGAFILARLNKLQLPFESDQRLRSTIIDLTGSKAVRLDNLCSVEDFQFMLEMYRDDIQVVLSNLSLRDGFEYKRRLHLRNISDSSQVRKHCNWVKQELEQGFSDHLDLIEYMFLNCSATLSISDRESWS